MKIKIQFIMQLWTAGACQLLDDSLVVSFLISHGNDYTFRHAVTVDIQGDGKVIYFVIFLKAVCFIVKKMP